MSDMGQGMVGAGGGPLREVDLAKSSRTRRSGSASQGSWIAPAAESDRPLFRRTWFVTCLAVLVLMIVLGSLLLAG